MATEPVNLPPFARDTGATADKPMLLKKRALYERIRASLLLERSTFESLWRDIGDNFRPRRTRFWITDRNKGDRRNQDLIDSTGTFASRTLQSGLHAGLTSPARPWMRLGTPDPSLSERGPVKAWLHTVTERMLAVFAQSNLYQALPVVYGDIGLFATAAMGVMEDEQDLIRCYTYPVGSYSVGIDPRGHPNVFVREYELSVRQVIDTFARNEDGSINWSILSDHVKSLWGSGSTEQGIELVWIVLQNEDADPSKIGAQYLPWASVHYERGREGAARDLGLLRESGFEEFPILVPRWDVTGEDAYGTDSPGIIALGDVKGLHVMQKRKAQAVEKQINPPLIGPAGLKTQKTSLLPGGINYLDIREGQKGLVPVHEVRASIRELVEDIREHQFRVRRAFYEDLFLMLQAGDAQRGRQPVTAREVDERHEEKLLALGPVLERTNDELLDPLVDRVFAIMDRAGLIPPAPDEMQGMTLRVEYISLMAQAQKLVGVAQQDRFMLSTAQLTEVWPEARHKIDINKAVDRYADLYGIDPEIVRPTDEAEARAEHEAKAAQAAQQAEQLKTEGAGVKSVADAAATVAASQGSTP